MVIGEYGRPRGVKVDPLDGETLRLIASSMRQALKESGARVDVARLVEHRLFAEYGVVFAVMEREELGDDEGRSYPDLKRLELRSDVYDALIADDHRARFTAMHEVGHLVLHAGIPLRRTASVSNHKIFEDSEWQSDRFAAEYLMPVKVILSIERPSAARISELCGVSLRAAMVRINGLKREGILRLNS